MKTTHFKFLITAALFFGWISANAFAAGPVTTGTVTAVVKEKGTLTVMSDQTHGLLNYTGMDKVVMMFGSGKTATLADLAVGQLVTVEYVVRDGKTVVAKLTLPDPKPAVPLAPPLLPLTAAERGALNSKAAKDDDITTQPGNKARLDNDITTKPGKKAAGDPDITKVPGK